MGDPADELVNTIEVAPTPVSVSSDQRVMRVRVSRSADRTSADGVAYRSYLSEVLIDCTQGTARHLKVDFYRLAAWKGTSHVQAAYAEGQPMPMQFQEVEPSPERRIIRAACQTSTITNN